MLAEGRDTREQSEIDGEGLPALEPGPTAVGEHPEPGDRAVDQDGEGQRPRVGRIPVGKLEGREGEEQDGRGPAAEAGRVGKRRFPAHAGALGRPGGGIRGGAPGAEHRPDVAEEDTERRQPEPEDHEDEARRDVLVGRRVPDRTGDDDEHEERERDRARDDAKRPTAKDALERGRKRPPGARPSEQWALPERPQRDEREDEDERGAVVEEPERDRQVPDPAEAVRERNAHLTG